MNTAPLNQWLVYCRPGFERDCAEETQAQVLEATENSGYLILQGKPRLCYSELAFTRQLLTLHHCLDGLSERDRLTPIVERVLLFHNIFNGLYLEVTDTNEGKALSAFTRRFQPLLENKLHEHGILTDDTTLPRLHIFFPDKQRVLVATSNPNNRNEALNGIHRVSMAHDAPSRSYLKLSEAFEVFLSPDEQQRWLRPKMTAVDLGAAPGGWTWQLVQRGMKVFAIDNGPLKGAAANHPAITHLRQDGFNFRPQRPVDWLVCDMVEQPQRVADLMTEWMLRGFAQHFVFNLKLPMKKRVTTVRTALDGIRTALNAKGIRHRMAVKQLYHDREEVTVFLTKAK